MNQLLELYKREKQIKYQIKQERGFLHKQYYLNNRRTFLFLDILFVLGILFNFGAVFMTNLEMNQQLQKQSAITGEPIVSVELNPIVADIHNFPKADEKQISSFWTSVLTTIVVWFVWIFAYLFYRRNVFTREGMTGLMIGVLCFVFLTGLNFFNDFGWFI